MLASLGLCICLLSVNAEDVPVTDDELLLLQTKLELKTDQQDFASPCQTSLCMGEYASQTSLCVEKYADSLNSLQPGLGDPIRSHPMKPVATSNRHIYFLTGSGTTGTRSVSAAFVKVMEHFNQTQLVTHSSLNYPFVDCTAECPYLETLKKLLQKPMPRPACLEQLHKLDFTNLPEDVKIMGGGVNFDLFIDLFISFPKAKFAHSVRPGDEWAASGARKPNRAFPIQEACGMMFNKSNLDLMANIFDLTNNFIKCVVPPERFLEIDLFSGKQNDTMKRIREFMNFPEDAAIDNSEFPSAEESDAVSFEGPCCSKI